MGVAVVLVRHERRPESSSVHIDLPGGGAGRVAQTSDTRGAPRPEEIWIWGVIRADATRVLEPMACPPTGCGARL